jgi:UDP:flavonoid glycosyltransferase YjiC (YdhE family)
MPNLLARLNSDFRGWSGDAIVYNENQTSKPQPISYSSSNTSLVHQHSGEYMRAVLTNIGSMGNIQPFVSLAAGLRDHGHDPVLALAPMYRHYVSQLGFEYVPIGFDLDYAKLQREDTDDTLNGVDPLHTLKDSLTKLEAMLPQMFEELRQACRGADVLIGGHLQPASRMLHELTGIPFVSVHTNHFGGMQPYAFRHATASVINPFRAQYGLPPVADPIHEDANSPQLALYAISRYLRPANPNWPGHYHVTGFFFLDERELIPNAELVQFLQEGEKPVVITFSSIAHPDPEAMTDLLVEAIETVGCRAVIQHGWSGLAKNRALPPNIFGIGFVQHTWLFARASCVVVAGGSGTQATTLRSGTPTVVVPHIGDQPMWGELARGIGCAGGVIHYRDLTAKKLASALQQTLSNQKLRARAAEVAQLIQAEQGVSRARVLIENLLQRTSTSSHSFGIAPMPLRAEITGRREHLRQNRSKAIQSSQQGEASE